MKVVGALALLLLLAAVRAGEVVDCKDFEGLSREEVQKEFQYARARDASFGPNCGLFLLNHNLTEQLETLIHQDFASSGTQIPDDLSREINKRASSFQRLKDVVGVQSRRQQNIELTTMAPAFRWAQSLMEVYIEVKFAHRFDSPGSNEISTPEVEFTSTTLKLKAKTEKMKGIDLKFELNLEFLHEVDPSRCKWELNSIGRVYIQMGKVHLPSRWGRLLSDKSHREMKNKMSLWIEMYDKYSKELDQYEPEDDEEPPPPPRDEKPDYQKKHPAEEAAERRKEEMEKRRQESEKRREEASKRREEARQAREEERKRREDERRKRDEERIRRAEERIRKSEGRDL